MSRDMRDLSPETYVVNPDTSSGIRLFAGIPFVYGGFRGFGGAAADRYAPPETADWLTKQSNEPSNVDDLPVVARFRAQVARQRQPTDGYIRRGERGSRPRGLRPSERRR
jgi:hypothetical protein